MAYLLRVGGYVRAVNPAIWDQWKPLTSRSVADSYHIPKIRIDHHQIQQNSFSFFNNFDYLFDVSTEFKARAYAKDTTVI